eukprot:scaffold2091_cov361-Prasinococcus_capsulatus_cf.AAC.3
MRCCQNPTITVSGASSEVETTVEIMGNQEVSVSLKTDILVEGRNTLTERYLAAKVLDQTVELPMRLQYERKLLVVRPTLQTLRIPSKVLACCSARTDLDTTVPCEP